MKVKDLLDQFCDYSSFIKGYTESTIRRYRMAINLYCTIGLVTEIEQVSKENVERFFYTGRHERKWAATSFVTHHKSLVVFFRWCVQKGYLPQNPADCIELPKTAKKLPPKLTLEEAQKVLKVTRNYPWYDEFIRVRNVAILATFLFSGLRRQELLNLEVTDVDLRAGSIFVRSGKGQKDRYIPICDDLRTMLSSYLDSRRIRGRTCPEFFTAYTLNQGMAVKGLQRIFNRMNEETGIKFSPHKLRHTFATLMLEGGCDIYSLSKMMGHSDISTTTIYLAASPEHLRHQMVKHPLANH